MVSRKQYNESLLTLYWRWVRWVSLGEFLGFLVLTAIGVLTVVLQAPQLLQTPAMVAAGLGEGIVLGYFQARVLEPYITGFDRAAWVRATAAGAGIAWAIGMLPSTLGEGLADISLLVIIPAAVLLGAALLLSIGGVQYLVLKRHVAHASRWIWINVFAWLGGLAAVFACIFLAPNGTIPTIAFSALGGMSMACTMALITGLYARRIMSSRAI